MRCAALLGKLCLLAFALATSDSFAPAVTVEPTTPRYTDLGPEPLLAGVMNQIEANQWEAALRQTDGFLKVYPNFGLAHRIKGDGRWKIAYEGAA